MSVKLKGARKICQVNGCSNSQFKMQQWKNELCPNQGFFRKDCSCCIQPYQLHRFPQAHRQEWVKNLNTKLTVNDLKDYHRICSIHFVDGKPTKEHPYPTLEIGYSLHGNWKPSPGRRAPRRAPQRRTVVQKKVNAQVDVRSEEPPIERMNVDMEQLMDVDVEPKYKDASTQYYSVEPLHHDHCYAKRGGDQATQTPSVPSMDAHDMNDKQFKFFTGLSSTSFWALLSSVMCWTTQLPSHNLPVAEQFLMVLMRLRLGLLLPDLGYRFNIATSTTSKIFNSWTVLLGQYARNLVHWIPRDGLNRIRPKCFAENYSKVTCIIDCTEIFVERPKDLMQRAQTYSNYKSHNTYKALYCIAPNGFVMFVSKLFGGRASDVFITKHSGFLNQLNYGDEVMAHRGFTIEELLPPGVSLTMPEFTRHHKDGILPEESVTQGRRIANVRIHMERAIRRLKCFKFLSHIIPGNVKNIDDILLICSALCNLQPNLINEQNVVDDDEVEVNED